MDEYQALEAIYTIRGVAAQDAMNFIAVLSAYLIVAYLVGSKLSQFQLWSISVLYSLFSLGPIWGFHIAILDMNASQYAGTHPTYLKSAGYIPLIMLFAWALSIAFMLEARRNPHTTAA